MKISASIYSSKETSLREVVEDLDQHSIDYIHIDCNDDLSVFDDIAQIRNWTDTPIDLHLITANPDAYFDRINDLAIELVTLQHESLGSYLYTGGCNAKLGMGIVSTTGIEVFEAYAESFDFVLMMATTPGKSGGTFDKVNFQKIRSFRKAFPDKAIHVDGGVNAEVSFILRNMGVNAAVVGSYLFRHLPLGAALLNLKTHDIDSHFVVADFMRSHDESPIVTAEGQNLQTVLQTIEDFKLGFAMLEDANGHLMGIVSNADMRKELLRNIDDPSNIQLERMINTNPITINDDTTVTDMLEFVRRFEFPLNYLPVVNSEGRVQGVVSFLNLVKGEL